MPLPDQRFHRKFHKFWIKYCRISARSFQTGGLTILTRVLKHSYQCISIISDDIISHLPTGVKLVQTRVIAPYPFSSGIPEIFIILQNTNNFLILVMPVAMRLFASLSNRVLTFCQPWKMFA